MTEVTKEEWVNHCYIFNYKFSEPNKDTLLVLRKEDDFVVGKSTYDGPTKYYIEEDIPKL